MTRRFHRPHILPPHHQVHSSSLSPCCHGCAHSSSICGPGGCVDIAGWTDSDGDDCRSCTLANRHASLKLPVCSSAHFSRVLARCSADARNGWCCAVADRHCNRRFKNAAGLDSDDACCATCRGGMTWLSMLVSVASLSRRALWLLFLRCRLCIATTGR